MNACRHNDLRITDSTCFAPLEQELGTIQRRSVCTETHSSLALLGKGGWLHLSGAPWQTEATQRDCAAVENGFSCQRQHSDANYTWMKSTSLWGHR